MQALHVNGPPENGTAAPAGTGSGRSNWVICDDNEPYRNASNLAMSGRLAGLAARVVFYSRAGLVCVDEGLTYSKHHGVSFSQAGGLIGGGAVLPIERFPGKRFVLADRGHDLAVVIEAMGRDETEFLDFVAWPVNEPELLFSMFGRVGLLGLWNVYNLSTYAFGYHLNVFRTGLEWLQAQCRGAVVVDPKIAARDLFECPGPVCGQDAAHSRALLNMADSILDRRKFLTPRRRVGA